MSNLEALIEEVQADHRLRLDQPDETPMVPRPFTPRPRPKTAIISRAAQRKIEMRTVLANALKRWGRS